MNFHCCHRNQFLDFKYPNVTELWQAYPLMLGCWGTSKSHGGFFAKRNKKTQKFNFQSFFAKHFHISTFPIGEFSLTRNINGIRPAHIPSYRQNVIIVGYISCKY